MVGCWGGGDDVKHVRKISAVIAVTPYGPSHARFVGNMNRRNIEQRHKRLGNRGTVLSVGRLQDPNRFHQHRYADHRRLLNDASGEFRLMWIVGQDQAQHDVRVDRPHQPGWCHFRLTD